MDHQSLRTGFDNHGKLSLRWWATNRWGQRLTTRVSYHSTDGSPIAEDRVWQPGLAIIPPMEVYKSQIPSNQTRNGLFCSWNYPGRSRGLELHRYGMWVTQCDCGQDQFSNPQSMYSDSCIHHCIMKLVIIIITGRYTLQSMKGN